MSDSIPLPTGGTVLFPNGTCTTLELRDLPADHMKPVADARFASAHEVNVDRQGDTPWAFLLRTEIDAPVRANDVVHVRFWARNVESMTGSARIAVTVEDDSGSQRGKIVDLPVTVGSDWECVDVPMVVAASHEPRRWLLTIRLGYAPQRLRIADLQVINYGQAVRVESLPRVRTSYDGREPDAPWREAARERIEKNRKRDVTVTLVDKQGRPLSGINLRATLVRHGFAFGTCISDRLLKQDDDSQRYRDTILSLFSSSVIENALKWPPIVERGYDVSDRLINWLRSQGLPVRGHCLVWPSKRFLPAHVVAASDDPKRFARLILDHIHETVSRYRGQLIDWDVINEPFAHHYAMDVLGPQAMVDWFHAAHEADPDARLYINDYEILESGDRLNTPHQEHYFKTVQYLLDKGAPVQGVGIQGHFGCNITSPEKMLKILDRFAAMGVMIQVTELDVQLGDEALRADFFRDALITLFSHPAVVGITQWGFWEGSHWIPQSALYDQAWNLRPHGQVFLDLVHREWKTDVLLTTDDNGRAHFRGFHGKYEFTADLESKPPKWTESVGSNTTEIRLSLNQPQG